MFELSFKNVELLSTTEAYEPISFAIPIPRVNSRPENDFASAHEQWEWFLVSLKRVKLLSLAEEW